MDPDSEPSQTQYDIIIIGAGPAGLATAIYTSSLRLKTLVLEGSTPPRLQLAHMVNNYPGFPEGITGTELLRRFREQALKFGAEIRQDDVIAANLDEDVKSVATRGTVASARSVVIATGVQQKSTEIPGEGRFLGVGVSYCAICDGPLFRGKIVAIAGDASESIEDALTMSHIAAKTYLITPSDDSQTRELKEANVEILKGFKIKAIVGTSTVEALELLDSRGNEQTLKVNGVFITSSKARLAKVLTESGVQTDNKGCVHVDGQMQTNIEGVYAAGDCTCGGLQVSTSVGEGVKAALSIFRSLRSTRKATQGFRESLG